MFLIKSIDSLFGIDRTKLASNFDLANSEISKRANLEAKLIIEKSESLLEKSLKAQETPSTKPSKQESTILIAGDRNFTSK